MVSFALFLFAFISAAVVGATLGFRRRYFVALVALAVSGFIAQDEIAAAYFRQSGNPGLSYFLAQVVEENPSKQVSDIVCPNVTREELDRFSERPGTTAIQVQEGRTVMQGKVTGGTYRSYFVRPRISIFQGLDRVLAAQRLTIVIYDHGGCLARVQSTQAL